MVKLRNPFPRYEMNLPTFLNKFILNIRFLRHTPFIAWFRLINHSNFRFDDYHRYWDFWNSINDGWIHSEYVNQFEKIWGKGSYPPQTITLSQTDFDALQERLNEPPDPKVVESVKKLMNRKAPWDD